MQTTCIDYIEKKIGTSQHVQLHPCFPHMCNLKRTQTLSGENIRRPARIKYNFTNLHFPYKSV